ncbi:uncharacterized protein KGF55_003490 [Candida pseudojiufengensis]|uniref:uncharacterized protein n=1 Tax=Candida pseudojiufengensis TaxID=497109 RepID=UPI00222476C7|nr:uncharacterized protein KGF55_003490 [Candida pseudojiufengensis]KAI5962414.1 hypothetical protein KGF55_003490 [Candida pseudojiufengensis]
MVQENPIVSEARAFLATSQPDKALEILSPHIQENQNSVEFLQLLGETYLENNELEQAYNLLTKACELDPEANLGIEKFLYLGQIIGGFDGINYINIGLNKLQDLLNQLQSNNINLKEINDKGYKTTEEYNKWIINKINSGIFASIEIWMTDLCMEEEAESKCNELINISLKIDPENPETYSQLSSIRISQQLSEEAIEALIKSWDLFKSKKTKLEDFANEKSNKEEDTFEIGMEYVELIQPLITLSKFAIELEQYDIASDIIQNVSDIKDSILDAYYIEALSNILKAKQVLSIQQNLKDQDYRDLTIQELSNSNNEEIKNLLNEAKLTLTSAYKIINSEQVEEFDPTVVEQINEYLNQLGGPIMSELLPKRDKFDETDENWENEIVSDDE